MNILYTLAGIRSPLLNTIFLALTQLGGAMAALFIPIIVYWCVNKKKGYFIMANVLFGAFINQTAKFFCRVPRPFVKDPQFEIVEPARAEAGGYSFPSGHANNVTAIFGSIAVLWKNTAVRVICAVLIALVGFSRLYLGVHYLTDVLGGLACALVVLAALHSLFKASEKNPRVLPILFGIGAAVSLVLALIVEFGAWGANVAEENHTEAVKNLNICFGCLSACAVFEPVERKYIRFETDAAWWAQVLKAVLGVALIIAVRAAMKPLVSALFGTLGIGTAVRYFVMVSFGIAVWPLSFRWFRRLGKKQ